MKLYCDETTLKEITNLSENVDIDVIKPNLIKAMDIDIIPFLGFDLNTELQTAIINNTITPKQQELLNIITKAMAHFTAHRTYVDILFKWMNKSAVTPSVENGVNMNKNDMVYVKDIAKHDAEFYLKQAKNFLEKNKTDFPSYFLDCDVKRPAFTIMFDHVKKCRCISKKHCNC